MAGVHNTLEGVVELLQWESDTIGIGRLCERFSDHIACLIALPSFAAAAGPSLVSGIHALPNQALRRFLRSPQLVSQIISWRRDRIAINMAHLAEMVLAELADEDIISDLPISVWTSRGDKYLWWENNDVVREITPWLIEGEIALDQRSSQMFPYDGTEQKLLLSLDNSDCDLVRKKLCDSLGTLSGTLLEAFRFVKTFLEQISIRLEPGAPTQFNSSSFSQFVGLALLNNPHLDRIDFSYMTEVLVHESVHSMLFMIEELDGPFLTDRSAALIQVRSPWSGSIINLNSYVHACLVWYAIYWLWTKLIEKKVYPEDRCLKLRERARVGFTRHPLMTIQSHRSLLSQGIIDVLLDVEEKMRAARASACDS